MPETSLVRSLRDLVRYRALLWALTVREVRARYRGSVLGFVWSFINPIILLIVYSFVWGVLFMPRSAGGGPGAGPPTPFGVFLFTGILPWTWFSGAILESAYTITHGGGVLKKVVFPAEILPLVSVLSNAVHFLVALPVLLVVLVATGHVPNVAALAIIPVAIVQLIMTIGLALMTSALSVLFRDVPQIVGHLLTVIFFASPVIYQVEQVPDWFRGFVYANPFAQIILAWQDALFFDRMPSWTGVGTAAVIGVAIAVAGFVLFDRLREVFPEEV